MVLEFIHSRLILQKADINPNIRTKELSEEQVKFVRTVIENGYQVEGDLRRQNVMDIKRLSEIRV